MAWITDQFQTTWRSGAHTGANAPVTIAEVRRGSWRRAFRDWTPALGNPQITASIPGETLTRPWYPIFTETTPWVRIPNLASCEVNQDFGQNGLSVLTLTLDNVAYVPKVGPLSEVYHAVERGWLSPSRGYDPLVTRAPSGLLKNEWYDVLTENANVRIWQGFGPPVLVAGQMPTDGGPNGTWVFNGLIDDVDLDAVPSGLLITARAGRLLTDSRVFGWNKSRQLKDPITFCDRQDADDLTEVGDNATASSAAPNFPATNVTDDDGTVPTYWQSQGYGTTGNTEWVQVKIPAGRYRSIKLECAANMELYVGIFAKKIDADTSARRDGVVIGEGFVGNDTVPGANGGWGFIHYSPQTAGGRVTIDLGTELDIGNDSTLRVGFRSLAKLDFLQDVYSAQVRFLRGLRRDLKQVAITKKWILVDDLSDVVRVVLRWAGYKKFEVEQCGVRLKGKSVWNRASFLIDIIKMAAERSGFIFYVSDPVDGNSEGLPTFRRNAALQRGLVIEDVKDTTLLNGVKTKRSQEPLAYIIRVRGRESKKGISLGGDSVKRITAVYRPPWTKDKTMAGVIKHVTHTEHSFRSLVECTVGCYLIAIAEALQAFTAVVEIPANPYFELDDQIGLLDTATGLNTRLWVSSRAWTWTGGETVTWKMTLQGTLIDTADLVKLIEEIDGLNFSPEVAPGQAGITAAKSSTPRATRKR